MRVITNFTDRHTVDGVTYSFRALASVILDIHDHYMSLTPDQRHCISSDQIAASQFVHDHMVNLGISAFDIFRVHSLNYTSFGFDENFGLFLK